MKYGFVIVERSRTLPLKELKITEDLLRLLKLDDPTFREKKERKRLLVVHHKRRDFKERLELISAVITMDQDRETVSLVHANVALSKNSCSSRRLYILKSITIY